MSSCNFTDRERIAEAALNARIAIDGDEADRLSWQIGELFGMLDRLAADGECEEISAEAIDEADLRADEVGVSLDRETLLAASPLNDGRYICVPRTVEDAHES